MLGLPYLFIRSGEFYVLDVNPHDACTSYLVINLAMLYCLIKAIFPSLSEEKGSESNSRVISLAT